MVNTKFIKIILILVILSFCFWLYYNSTTLDTNNCTITLKTKTQAPITYTAEELYNQSKGGNCPIVWDRVQGYVQG